jgi:hypothetical protein
MFSTVCFAANNEEIIRLTKHKVPVMNHFAFRGICYTIGCIISHCIVQCNYLTPDIKPLVSSVFVSRTYSTQAVLSSFLPFHDQDAATTVSRELTIFSLVLNWNYTLWVIIDAHLISSNSKRELLDFTTVLLTLLGHLSSFPVFNGVHVARSLVFFVVFCGSLSFDLWPLTIVLFPSIYSFLISIWYLQPFVELAEVNMIGIPVAASASLRWELSFYPCCYGRVMVKIWWFIRQRVPEPHLIVSVLHSRTIYSGLRMRIMCPNGSSCLLTDSCVSEIPLQ